MKTVQRLTASPTFAFVSLFAAPLHAWPEGQPLSFVHTRPQNGASSPMSGTSGAVHVGALMLVTTPASFAVGAAVKDSWPIQPISFW